MDREAFIASPARETGKEAPLPCCIVAPSHMSKDLRQGLPDVCGEAVRPGGVVGCGTNRVRVPSREIRGENQANFSPGVLGEAGTRIARPGNPCPSRAGRMSRKCSPTGTMRTGRDVTRLRALHSTRVSAYLLTGESHCWQALSAVSRRIPGLVPYPYGLPGLTGVAAMALWLRHFRIQQRSRLADSRRQVHVPRVRRPHFSDSRLDL
jgi:hypothetical protein